jgi:hypothetical protein
MEAAMMRFGLGFDSHKPHGTMRLGSDAVRTGRLLCGLDGIETVKMPVHGLGQGSVQGPVRQNRATYFPAPFR